MSLDEKGEWVRGARYAPSPNFDSRPPDCAPDLIVVHGISLPPGEFGGPWIESFFCNRLDAAEHEFFSTISDLRVSAHLLVRRAGDAVQFVALSRRAWHAGESCWQGRRKCNDFSIGIELEGSDFVPYTPAQYDTLALLCRLSIHRWPAISAERIVGHSDIAPGRKTDPGPAFEWDRLRARLRSFPH
ncbi:MAG: 1,6-anhydro-N-acetylmuramyl-L-alanine amidase AmpD [Ectothiorhodospiraceae bacterium AqS1]|nr:1,6-anhydro-N-acetylmuramyl-L-alanine amidase AmpD [Ectothiorhodospiraceae bacterium AqS1]